MGWIFILVLALIVFVALWRFGRLDKGGLQFLGAALLLAFAGYAWQGHPALAGSPRHPPEHRGLSDSEFAKIRHDLMGRFNNADMWLTMAEGYERGGDTLGGAQIIEAGLRAHPNDPDLWVGLGNALVVHGSGMISRRQAGLRPRRRARAQSSRPLNSSMASLCSRAAESTRRRRSGATSSPPRRRTRRCGATPSSRDCR